MDRDKIIKAIEDNMPWHESRYFRKGDVKSILEVAGYFEVIEALRFYATTNVPVNGLYEHGKMAKDALRKAGVLDEPAKSS